MGAGRVSCEIPRRDNVTGGSQLLLSGQLAVENPDTARYQSRVVISCRNTRPRNFPRVLDALRARSSMRIGIDEQLLVTLAKGAQRLPPLSNK